MRHLALLILSLVLLAGCSKKKPEPVGGENKPDDAPADTTAADRARWFAALKGTNEKSRLDAVDELAAWVDSDPETMTALVELLKDKTTAGLGKTHPTQIRSTREAAARTLALAGPKGEAAFKDKGFAALREGLKDPQPAVREHTADTTGLLGLLATPRSADVMKRCTDADANVRGIAFDALRSIGITDVSGFAALLNHENTDIGSLAAELVPGITEIPDAA